MHSSGRVWGILIAAINCLFGCVSGPIDLKTEFVVHVPKMTCISEGQFGYCFAEDVGTMRTRWTLHTEPLQTVEDTDIRFRAPVGNTVIEMAVTDYYGDVSRTCIVVSQINGKARFRPCTPDD